MQNVLSKTALLSVLVGLAACSGGGANVSTSAQPSSSMGSFPAARASVVAPARAAYAQTVQPDENIALAIARRRIKTGGDIKAALELIPITKPIYERYRALVASDYPHLEV